MSMGASVDNGALNRNTMSQNLNNNKSKEERKIWMDDSIKVRSLNKDQTKSSPSPLVPNSARENETEEKGEILNK